MKQQKISRLVLSLLLFAATSFYTGCSQEQAVGLDDLPSTTTDGGTEVDDTAGFYVRAKYDVAFPYTTHVGTGLVTDDWTETCRVMPGDATTDITCIVEARELDLYFNGFEMEYNVPGDMCEYVSYMPPYYYNYEPGNGGTVVVENTGTAANGGLNPGEITVDGVLTSELYCPYDYSTKSNPASPLGDGPNCCGGSYSKTTYTDDSVDTEAFEWGGKPANCLKGPAMDIQSLMADGYPFYTYIRTGSEGTSGSYTVASPISKSQSSNIYASNYFVAADHALAGGVPRAFAAANGAPSTEVYHEFRCLDRNEDVQARIRIMVREWNTNAQFSLGSAGDPDTGGAEVGHGNPVNNDRWDFKDFGDSYPQEEDN